MAIRKSKSSHVGPLFVLRISSTLIFLKNRYNKTDFSLFQNSTIFWQMQHRAVLSSCSFRKRKFKLPNNRTWALKNMCAKNLSKLCRYSNNDHLLSLSWNCRLHFSRIIERPAISTYNNMEKTLGQISPQRGLSLVQHLLLFWCCTTHDIKSCTLNSCTQTSFKFRQASCLPL